jgi:hypothetical protein
MANNNKNLPLGTALAEFPADAIFPNLIGAQVAAPSPYIQELRIFWQQVDALWSGTLGMRAAGKMYLPQEPEERDSDYMRRLNRTTLHNFYKNAIMSASARVFTRDPHLEAAPIELELFTNDVDNQGRNMAQFAKSALEDAMNHGVSYILVDYSRLPEDYVSLADEIAAGNRPYWISVPANNVLDARSEKFGGSERLAYFRYEEQVTELSSDLITHQTFRQVRIFRQFPAGSMLPDGSITPTDTPVLFAVYRHIQGDIWKLMDSGTLVGIDVIPVVPIYTNRIGFFIGKPPLQDLAELNIQHWQNSSDYHNILHVVTVPILFAKGLQGELDEDGNRKQITISPHQAVITANQDAEISWIEHTGDAVGTARQQLIDLEGKMEKLGLTLTSPTPGGVTATEHAISASESNSILKSMALNLQDALVMALGLTAEYMGTSPLVRVVVNTDYAVDYTSDTTMQNVIDMFTSGVIDKETVIAEGKRRNILDPTADIEPPDETPATEAKEPNDSATGEDEQA